MGAPTRTLIYPELPVPGDTIGVIAPASSFDREKFQQGCDHLRQLGYKVFFHESIFEKYSYFAGSHERRAWELRQMFEKAFVKAIFCARGGYGSNYLLPLLDIDLVRDHPKLLMGYSDITSLLSYIHDQTGLVTFHGPMVAKDLSEANGETAFKWTLDESVSGAQIHNGKAAGKLYGGCLSMLTASLGTRYAIETADTILFIEDVATKPFQIDRMLTHLRLSGKLEGVRGIVFGEMPDCLAPGMSIGDLQNVCAASLTGFTGPIGWGLRSGHLSEPRMPGVILPIGVNVELTVEDGRMSIRQSN